MASAMVTAKPTIENSGTPLINGGIMAVASWQDPLNSTQAKIARSTFMITSITTRSVFSIPVGSRLTYSLPFTRFLSAS